MNAYRSIALASLFTVGTLVAVDGAQAADAPAPSLAATANINLVSQYRFRGIDQTWGRPAAQGGADLAWASGFYAGVWASNVSGNSYPGGNLEVDVYGGYNGKVGDDLSWTAGGYGYWYPGANYSRSACPSALFPAPCAMPSQRLNTFELNAGVTWKWISYKLSVSTGDYFGAGPSTGYSRRTRGTMYHDLTGTWPLADDLSLAAHVGRTDVRAMYGSIDPDYTDYRVALSKTFPGGWNVSAAVVGATNDALYRPPTGGLSLANGDTRELNKPVLVLQAGRSF
jgi:uncharacterized protein (TIGR02001 family)